MPLIICDIKMIKLYSAITYFYNFVQSTLALLLGYAQTD